MAKTKHVDSDYSDVLGITAFISAIGNVVQADNNNKLSTLYNNLLIRYRDVCSQYQTLTQINHQLQREVLDLRQLNNMLQRRMTSQSIRRTRRRKQAVQTP